MNIGKAVLLALLAAASVPPASSAAPVIPAVVEAPSFRRYRAADLMPLAPSAVAAAPAKPKAASAAKGEFESVEASLTLVADGLKGGCETARSAGDSPFRTLQSSGFKLPAAVRAASQRCPDGLSWRCVPSCAGTNPRTGECDVWIPVCGCM